MVEKDIVMKIRVPQRLIKKIRKKAYSEYTTMTEIIRRQIVRSIR